MGMLCCKPGAMILGSTLAVEAGLKDATPFMFFPLMVHAMDIIVSSIGILYVGTISTTSATTTYTSNNQQDPMTILKGGYKVTAVRHSKTTLAISSGSCFQLEQTLCVKMYVSL